MAINKCSFQTTKTNDFSYYLCYAGYAYKSVLHILDYIYFTD